MARALARLERVFTEVEALLSAAEAGQAFQDITRLSDKMRELTERVADLRAQLASRIATEDALSLAGLAQRIGVSRARAGQLMQAARKTPSPTQPIEGQK